MIDSRFLTDEDIYGANDNYGTRRRLNGLFKGIVVSVADHQQLGRVKVRIPQLHGENLINPQDLPWAQACLPPGGGRDYGAVVVPPINSNVWVMFEQGDPQKPVWVGSWTANRAAKKKIGGPIASGPKSEGVDTSEQDPEVVEPTAVTGSDSEGLEFKVAAAIKKIESDGRYHLPGASGEYGAYQFMPKTWEAWSRDYMSATGAPKPDITVPADQDAVALWRISTWLDKAYSPQQIASLWNSGSPDPTGKVGVNSRGVQYNVPAYVEKFNKAFGAAPSSSDMVRKQNFGNKAQVASEGNEMPREAQAMANHEPTVQVWSKSPKGHAIVVEDRDGVERLTVTDRAGNVISMECPVKDEENVGNKEQRGTRSVLTGDALDRDKMRDGGSNITIQDQAQSIIEMDSRKGDEKVTIAANDGEGGIQTGLNRQRIELLAGANRILVESVRDGKTLARLTLDSNTGVVTIEGEVIVDISAPHVNISADHINLNGAVNIGGDVTVSGRITGGKS
jgi:hypothetical protein